MKMEGATQAKAAEISRELALLLQQALAADNTERAWSIELNTLFQEVRPQDNF